MRTYAFLAAATAILLAAPASAAVIVENFTIDISGDTNRDILSSPFPGFDPSLGTLLSVAESASGSTTWTPGGRSADLLMLLQRTLAIQRVSSLSGDPQIVDISLKGVSSFGFKGPGLIQETLVVTDSSDGTLSTATTLDGTVTYTYTPSLGGSAVPEPSTWAMMLIGFSGFGYAAFRRKMRLGGNSRRGAMKYGGRDVHLRTIVVVALLSTGVLASARAAQVEVSNPDFKAVAESQDTIDIMFGVNNTGVPDKVAVDIGEITEFVTKSSGDTENDVLSDGSIIETTTCGTLGVKKGCDVLARYDILDADPFDKDKHPDVGVWNAGISVPWTTIDGMHSGSASGMALVIVGDPQSRFAIPEPSTWVGLLVGFSALGLVGYFRARSGSSTTA
jgi:PEP-CTERM motif